MSERQESVPMDDVSRAVVFTCVAAGIGIIAQWLVDPGTPAWGMYEVLGFAIGTLPWLGLGFARFAAWYRG